MKKYYTTEKYKKWNRIHNKYKVAQKKSFKYYIKLKNKYKRTYINHKTNIDSIKNDFYNVNAPNNFSFINNTEELIDFIKVLKNHYDKSEKVNVLLADLNILTNETIVVLLSIMVKFKTKGIDFNGNKPKNKAIKNIIDSCGFYNFAYRMSDEKDSFSYDKNHNIVTHGYKYVDSKLSEKLIIQESSKIWGSPRLCHGVQSTIIELMTNTNNHASVDSVEDKNWWLSVNYEASQNKSSFAFIDYGVGIFESLNSKPESNILYNAYFKLKQKYNNNVELLLKILEGELHSTVTGQSHRGKGLPNIFKSYKNNYFNKLIIITNDVYIDFELKKFEKLKQSFSGTFVYWELTQYNKNIKDDD